MRYRSVSATHDEHTRRLPGDELIPNTIGQLTHAITIHRPPRDVWPWLVQMGAGSRGGWYSYDRLDNGGHPSASRVLPHLQQIAVGTLFPALPGRIDGFHVLAVDSGVSLVLGWRAPGGDPIVTWAFVLEDALNSTTRLVTRVRASAQYPFFGLPRPIGDPVVRAVHFVMQRKQLLGIARRAEQFDALLDQLMPDYDIIEHHSLRVEASPDVALAAAEHVDLRESLLVRAILRVRALAMGAKQPGTHRPHGLITELTSMGWRVLAEIPGHEMVLGAAAQPWLADVTFRPLSREAFAAFDEPGHVKIIWTLRVDPAFPTGTMFRTETRALATDANASHRFRRYWARVVPGVVAIRWILLRLFKKAAEANQLQSLAHGRTH